MTREEAKKLFKKASDFSVNYFDHTEVISLNQVDIVLNQIFNDNEAQIKAKDEEIEKLRTVLTQISCQSIVAGFKLGENKARSIVAMLFWKWRRDKRFAKESCSSVYYAKSEQAENLFQQAQKMLKDKKC